MRAKSAKPKTQAPAGREPRALTHPEIKTIVLGIMLAMFLGALDQTIVATALPTIGRHFGNLNDLSWVVTAYLLTGTAVDAALRQAVRHPRPARHDAHGHRHFHRRLGRLRAGAEHDRAGARRARCRAWAAAG